MTYGIPAIDTACRRTSTTVGNRFTGLHQTPDCRSGSSVGAFIIQNMTGSCNHQALRAATADCHAQLDDLFSRFDLSDRADYGRFLRAHAAVVPSLEAALDQAELAALLPDWARRHRSLQLLEDLWALDLEPPAASSSVSLQTIGATWGAAYVLEGSRLGGAVLSRRLPVGAPRAYLGCGQPPSAWPDFLKRLDVGLESTEALQAAIAAAQAVFALFEAAGRREMGTGLDV